MTTVPAHSRMFSGVQGAGRAAPWRLQSKPEPRGRNRGRGCAPGLGAALLGHAQGERVHHNLVGEPLHDGGCR
jgi:hypothetical protein